MRGIIFITLAFFIASGAHAGRGHKVRETQPPKFSAKSYLVADSDGQILKEQDGESVRPIASISKLMVALLSSEQNLDEELDIPGVRKVHSSIPKKVNKLTRKELLTLALVKSDNLAAQVLCDNLPECVDKMNSKAQELGMNSTHYSEPTGLSSENVSTAHDLLRLLLIASSNPTITELSRMPQAEIPTGKTIIKVKNTNPLTAKFDILLSKTGFTAPAGGCLVMIMNSEVGQRILILLGSKNAKTRVPDMERLVKEL